MISWNFSLKSNKHLLYPCYISMLSLLYAIIPPCLFLTFPFVLMKSQFFLVQPSFCCLNCHLCCLNHHICWLNHHFLFLSPPRHPPKNSPAAALEEPAAVAAASNASEAFHCASWTRRRSCCTWKNWVQYVIILSGKLTLVGGLEHEFYFPIHWE